MKLSVQSMLTRSLMARPWRCFSCKATESRHRLSPTPAPPG
jgi:hypothetical protein